MVGAVRRYIGRRIEPAPRNRFVERGETVGDIVRIGKVAHAVRVDIDRADQLDAFDVSECAGMGVGHAARAENQDTHAGAHR